MKQKIRDSIVRRWGFYSGNRLAFAGVARRSSAGELHLSFIEAEHLAHTATLPQRLGFEQLIRERARSDIEQAMGTDGGVSIYFEPRKLNERSLARTVFKIARPRTLSDSKSA